MKTALVCGSSGFIGGHLVKRLKSEGYFVIGADIQDPQYEKPNRFYQVDLRDQISVLRLFMPNRLIEQYSEINEVYQLAADMGGAGYIFTGEHDAHIMHNSAQINLNIAEACRLNKVDKIFYSSSACMYPQNLQDGSDRKPGMEYYGSVFGFNPSLKESDAYPANPDSEYGWEKLFSERLFLAYQRNYNLNVRIARFHNIYGPMGTYKGGREKAPAAICRKVIENDSSVVIWGDGEQTRSFLYIDDCIDAVRLLMQSDFTEPINIGSEEMVSINELAKMAMFIGGKDLHTEHIDGPQGVRGRNSNNDLIRKVLKWEPKYSLMEGLGKTYTWINSQMK
jgi:GDP-D-mannose 3',5'-epimerase